MQEETRQLCVNEVERRRKQLLELEHFLHDNPELGLQEHLAAAKLREMLRADGFEVEAPFTEIPTAVVAHKKNGDGPRLGIVAEYDALPELGHACGHNLIAAMSMGAAMTLGTLLEQYQGEVWLIGTPAEEIASGKQTLLDMGVFNNVDLAMMIHPGNQTIPAPVTLASISMEFHYQGRSSHAGSAPEAGINALDAVILLFNSINALRQQTREDSRIHGIIPYGGTLANMIPDKASAQLVVRSKSTDYCRELADKVCNCARAAAQATGAELEINYFEGNCDSLESNQKLADIFRDQLEYLGIPEFTGDTSSASTDMGNVSRLIPAIHPLLKVTKRPEPVDHHTHAYAELTGSEEVEDATIDGAKLMALVGLEVLEDPLLLEAVKNSPRI